MALEYLTHVTRRRSVVFLVSDFLSKNFERALRVASRRHDLVAIHVSDPRETDLPNVGYIEFEDAETGERLIMDTRDPQVREDFAATVREEDAKREKLFKSISVDSIDISTDRPYVQSLIHFFRLRARRFR